MVPPLPALTPPTFKDKLMSWSRHFKIYEVFSNHHVCAIFDSLLGVECSLLACESLQEDIRDISKGKVLTAKIESTSHDIIYLADNFALLGEQHVWSSLSVAAPESIFAARGWNKK